MNQGFRNSEVYVNLNLHCIERYLGEETDNLYFDMYEYKVKKIYF